MSNAFERHGIDHLSASSINLFAAQPALWVMEKLLHKRGGVGPAAFRGSAVEAGVEVGLFDHDMPVEDCIAIAQRSFETRCGTLGVGDPKQQKEAANIGGMVEQALAELRGYGVPDKPEDGRQHKIETMIGDCPVPFIGYLDFDYGAHGIVVDLKTTTRLPSYISDAHARQAAIYSAAKHNADVRMTYATPKKVATYSLENAEQHRTAVEKIALCIDRLLSLSEDPEELAGAIAPDFSSFYWGNSAARAAGAQVWGF